MDRLFAIVVINAIVFLCIFFMAKKKLSKMEIYITALFSSFLSLLMDIVMSIFFDTFYYFNKGIEPRDLIYHLFIYPLTNLLFLNYYPFLKQKSKQVLHFIFWISLSLGIEWIYVKTGIFVYQNWNFVLSCISYPLLFVLLFFHLKWIRKHLN